MGFDHVTIRVSDRSASERFYDTVLAVLGIERTHVTGEFTEWRDFSLAAATAEKPLTRGLHIGFAASSREHVDEFWRIGTEAGYRDDGRPGLRSQYGPDYYGAFLLDPDGNSAEAVHQRAPRGNAIDHLWIRVRDVEAAQRFYETVAPFSGFHRRGRGEDPERAFFDGGDASLSVVRGTPTENAHVAFPAARATAVEGFHRAGLEAGYRDNGPPGERPEYHPGYHAAFLLDPDGNNVEVVDHGRESPE
jgi:catechol 2,3-dioxygenase-like lactoylglutathione lyase family enzyme